jgi:hypothetical protein
MFRGGRVSSYGTGIASGLADGGMPPKRGLVDGPGGYAGKPQFKTGTEIMEEVWTKPWLTGTYLDQTIPTEQESAEETAGSIYDVKTEPKKIKITSPRTKEERWVDNPKYEAPTKTEYVGRYKTPTQVELTDAEIAAQEQEGKWDPGVGQAQHIPTNALLQNDNDEVVPELSAKEMVAENKALFADLLGVKKARGADISDMLLGFAGAEGDDTWSKFKSFTRDEAKRPSRVQKLEDTAAGLAIQDYIAGKRSKENIEALKGKIDYEYDKKLKMSMPQKDDTAQVALYKIASLTDSKSGSDSTIKEFIKFKTGAPTVRNDKIKMKDLDNPKKQKKLTIGYNIIEEDGVKNIVYWDGTTAQIVTLQDIWAQE